MRALVLLLIIIAASCAQDLVGCGGFIRSVAPIPYARIQVSNTDLFNSEGTRDVFRPDEAPDIFRITEVQDRVCSQQRILLNTAV